MVVTLASKVTSAFIRPAPAKGRQQGWDEEEAREGPAWTHPGMQGAPGCWPSSVSGKRPCLCATSAGHTGC